MKKISDYAKLVSGAYDQVLPAGFDLIHTLPYKFGWVLKDSIANEIIVVVRGTASISDWLQNAEFDQIQTSLGNIHRGFWEDSNMLYNDIYAKIWAECFPELNTSIDKHPRITFVGHSLGAAIVTIMAARFGADFYIDLVSFNSPRVGDDTFKANYSLVRRGNTYRLINKLDIVSLVPEGFGYRHVVPSILHEDYKFGDILYNHSIDRWLSVDKYLETEEQSKLYLEHVSAQDVASHQQDNAFEEL